MNQSGLEAVNRPMNVDDREHFARLASAVAKERDQSAFTALFDFFAPRLKSFLMRQGMDAGQAEDMAQEVMVVLWHKAHLYDPTKSSLSTWLFRIARNRRIDLARRDRGRKIDETDPLLQPSEPPSPDEGLEHDDREQQVREALKKLPQEQTELVRMAFFFGRTHTEISQETGLPLGTVKSRIRLAFAKLKTMLDDNRA